MLTESDRLTRLVQQIIELSRLQADDPLETPTAVSIDDVHRHRGRHQRDRRRTPSASTSSPAARTGLEVLGNEEQVTAAVANLVANAVSYSALGLHRPGHHEGRRGHRSRSRSSTRASASRTDEIDRIFERFYRVDPARHRSTGGTGLGLSIVKHVAATHGGDVRVWSVEGQGSTFTLTLPQHQSHHGALALDHPEPIQKEVLQVTRVLVVEDEESYSEALAYMLRKEGFEVAIAADGNAALTEFDRNGADIVLLDLMLPGHPRHRGVPHDPADLERPGDHGQRQGRRGRQGGRARARRRRLRHQALLPARAGRPDPRGAAPRHRSRTCSPATLEAGPVRMDVERHVVTVDGEEQRLPLKEFELLEMFLRNPGRVLTRGQLIDRVWGSDYVGDTKTLDVHVKRLRAKLEPDPSEPKYLVTVRGLGYKLDL